jgi:hypothetical protein
MEIYRSTAENIPRQLLIVKAVSCMGEVSGSDLSLSSVQRSGGMIFERPDPSGFTTPGVCVVVPVENVFSDLILVPGIRCLVDENVVPVKDLAELLLRAVDFVESKIYKSKF